MVFNIAMATSRKDINVVTKHAVVTGLGIPIPVPERRQDLTEKSLMSLKDIHLQNDGSVDLTFNMKVVNMIALLDAYSAKSFSGEMTLNPLPANFSFSMMNSKVCEDVPNLKFLIYVHTAPGNSAKRDIIRSTWAKNGLFKDDSSRVVFLMGKPSNDKERDVVLDEMKQHDDMVVGDFTDNYRNLTLKAIMGLKWTTMFCNKAAYVIKADDDAFVNIFEIRRVLRQYDGKQRILACPLWKDNTMPILRDPSKCMKWCVRFNEFPGRTHFPQYCAGLAFVMSREIVPELYAASRRTPFFWIDDVYISGMLVPKVGNVQYVDLLKHFTLKEAQANEEYSKPPPHKITIFLAHVKKKEIFYKMWNATLHRLSSEEVAQLGDYIFEEYPSLKKLHKLGKP